MSDDSPPKQALARAAQLVGGQAGIAKLLGYSDRRNVWPWFNTDRPFPAEHCPALERESGRLGEASGSAAVTCEELRPDVAWHRVPDPDWPWHPAGRPLIDLTRQARAEQSERRAA